MASGNCSNTDRPGTHHDGRGVVLQPARTASGIYDLVTGAAAGRLVADGDVDGGVTSIRSKAIALPATGKLQLTVKWYLAHTADATNADYFRISIVSGITELPG